METLRKFGVNVSLIISDFGGEVIGHTEIDSWEESLGIWIRKLGSRLFSFAYAGSGMEIEDALNHSEDEIPSDDFSIYGIEARRNAPEDSFYYQENGRLA